MKNKEPDPAALEAMTAGLRIAKRRSGGQFDSLFGSLPEGTATVLEDVVTYLRQYLLDERGLAESEIRRIVSGRSVSPLAEDEGVKVALGILNSVASVMKVRDDQYKVDSEKLSKSDAIVLLLGGRDALQHHRRKRQQRKYAKEASKLRSEAREHREAVWLPVARMLRERHSEWSNAKLASEVLRAAKGVSVSLSTIRQALPRHGLSKKV
jgi:hypothetical protein